MKKIISIISLVIVMILSFTMFACNNENSDSSFKKSNKSNSSYSFSEQNSKSFNSQEIQSGQGNSIANSSRPTQSSSQQSSNHQSSVPQRPIFSEGLEYELIEGGYQVVGIGTCLDVEIVIPSTYNDLPVISIDRGAFSENHDITHVTIGDNVEEIGGEAFLDCEQLQTVTVGEKVSNIQSEAFIYCERLVEVYNKSSLSISAGSENYGYVGFYALNVYTEEGGSLLYTDNNGFVLINAMDNVTVVDYVGSQINIVIPNNVTKIGYWAFSAKPIISVEIPEGVTSIECAAFCDCVNLVEVSIPDSVREIGEDAFNSCILLSNISMGNNVEIIGDSAFRKCESLVNFEIKNSVKYIGYRAFKGCSNLNSVSFECAQSWTVSEFDSSDEQIVNVTNSQTNATNLVEVYCDCTWNKAEANS